MSYTFRLYRGEEFCFLDVGYRSKEAAAEAACGRMEGKDYTHGEVCHRTPHSIVNREPARVVGTINAKGEISYVE